VPISEQISWRRVFSDGIERDSGDVLLELMEFAIQLRTADNLPTTAFSTANPPPNEPPSTTAPTGVPADARPAATRRAKASQSAAPVKKSAAKAAPKKAGAPRKKPAAKAAAARAAGPARRQTRGSENK